MSALDDLETDRCVGPKQGGRRGPPPESVDGRRIDEASAVRDLADNSAARSPVPARDGSAIASLARAAIGHGRRMANMSRENGRSPAVRVWRNMREPGSESGNHVGRRH